MSSDIVTILNDENEDLLFGLEGKQQYISFRPNQNWH